MIRPVAIRTCVGSDECIEQGQVGGLDRETFLNYCRAYGAYGARQVSPMTFISFFIPIYQEPA
jgi:hypothetical protein